MSNAEIQKEGTKFESYFKIGSIWPNLVKRQSSINTTWYTRTRKLTSLQNCKDWKPFLKASSTDFFPSMLILEYHLYTYLQVWRSTDTSHLHYIKYDTSEWFLYSLSIPSLKTPKSDMLQNPKIFELTIWHSGKFHTWSHVMGHS